MISLSTKVNDSFTKGLRKAVQASSRSDRTLAKYGQKGVEALAAATPVDTGETAESWKYVVVRTSGGVILEFHNTHISPGGAPVALLIQYGHGTRNGGYVQGRDYINPALHPIFDNLAVSLWKEMTS